MRRMISQPSFSILEIGVLVSLISGAYILYTREEDKTQQLEERLRKEMRQERRDLKDDLTKKIDDMCKIDQRKCP